MDYTAPLIFSNDWDYKFKSTHHINNHSEAINNLN
jgi:hypothetical protein